MNLGLKPVAGKRTVWEPSGGRVEEKRVHSLLDLGGSVVERRLSSLKDA